MFNWFKNLQNNYHQHPKQQMYTINFPNGTSITTTDPDKALELVTSQVKETNKQYFYNNLVEGMPTPSTQATTIPNIAPKLIEIYTYTCSICKQLIEVENKETARRRGTAKVPCCDDCLVQCSTGCGRKHPPTYKSCYTCREYFQNNPPILREVQPTNERQSIS